MIHFIQEDVVAKTIPKWVTYSAVNSVLCILGALCVPLISVLSKPNSNSNHNTKLVNYGLSLSAGSMITTSLYKMLPIITHENRFKVFFGVASGIVISLLLNFIVHSFASQSLIHCAHDEGDEHNDAEHHQLHHHNHGDDIILHGGASYGSIDNQSHSNGAGIRSNSIQHSARTLQSNNSSLIGRPANNAGGNLNRRTSIIDLINKANPLAKKNSEGSCTPLLKADHGAPCLSQTSIKGSKTSDRVVSNGKGQNQVVPSNVAPSTGTTDATANDNIQEEDEEDDDDQNGSYAPTDDASFYPGQCKMACMENTIGYDLENLSVYRKNYFSGNDKLAIDVNDKDTSSSSSDIPEPSEDTELTTHQSAHSTRSHTHSHHHHHYHDLERELATSTTRSIPTSMATVPFHYHQVETPFSKLLSIGMQTCLVLTLHKFPEGFIIFYTNKSNKDSKTIGFSIFLSLAIHNFVEGFAMTLPFYSIFENKWLSILITTVLGGGSQPLGALIGYLIFKDRDQHNPNTGGDEPNMDLLLSITAGFLLVIALQMFQTGIGFSDGHHHHEDDDSTEIQKSHSLGTTCLKWCCAGVLLILASSIFV
ncbi:hypothetical protein C6P45_000761 [Maudiozyma exigua]|uniref:Zinc-regulated transporter 3 n=1 Tax=Maudiozyma exigua TaxID=34358 RepID=A0A9P7B757_MAUEX|nr:hypothetical protein C6P45_000761 [Kazachstania exigua]